MCTLTKGAEDDEGEGVAKEEFKDAGKSHEHSTHVDVCSAVVGSKLASDCDCEAIGAVHVRCTTPARSPPTHEYACQR